MTKTEKLIKAVYHSYRRERIPVTSRCPDELTLACFCEGRLTEGQLRAIQKHIISCSHCAEIVLLFK